MALRLVVRKVFRKFMGCDVLILTTIGRKSGTERTTPVGGFPGKDAVTAGQLHAAERAEAWQRITATSPQFARFQRKTDRELPVIRLMPRSDLP